MRLAKDGNNLRHLETERPVLVGDRGAMTLRLMLLSFDRVRPNLDALPGERSSVACAAYGATHPEATLADPIHDRRALAVVVGPARHRRGRCDALRACGQQEPGNPGCQDGAASGEEVAAAEYDGGHGNSSWRPCSCSADRTASGAGCPEFSAVRPISIGRNNGFVNRCVGRSTNVVDEAYSRQWTDSSVAAPSFGTRVRWPTAREPASRVPPMSSVTGASAVLRSVTKPMIPAAA